MRTELSLEDLVPILAPFDLRPRNVERIEKGTINSNFRVDTDGGTVFVRVNEGKREADLRYEGALLWHLGARRFPTPPPLRTSAGEPFVRVLHLDPHALPDSKKAARLVTVFPWWPGYEIAEEDISVSHIARVGNVLARLHVDTADFAPVRAGIYTFERIVERVEFLRSRIPHAHAPELADVLPVLDEEVAFLRKARASAALASLPAGTLHGDLFPDNLLFTPRPRTRRVPAQPGHDEEISAVLDFEQACHGRYIYDLAVTLLAWCWSGDRLADDKTWALVSGYQRVRPLSEAERDSLLVEARFAAFRFTVTRITDVLLPSLPPESLPARPGKDFRDYLSRLLFLRRDGEEALGTAVCERPPLRAV